MFKKKYIITCALALMVILSAISFNGCGEKKKEIKQYNVVLIVIDTLRSDHLPFYGYKKNTAPFLNDLSKESVVFKNAFAASSWTSPATASIFTSMYPFQHGVLMGLLAIRNAQKIDPDVKINRIPEKITTITEVMKANGYQTYGVADNLNIDDRQGFTQGFDKFRTFMYKSATTVNSTIKKWHKQLTTNGKYFLYIHYMDPHAPYHAREPWYEKFEDRRKHRISSYDSEISFCDQHIKELYELFKWDQNTIVIVTADHGEGLWDHGLMGHGKTLYREEIQVPLMIHLPGNMTHREIKENVCTIDILPTVRGLLGLPESDSDVGLSLVPLIENMPEENHPHNFKQRDLYAHLWVKTDKVVEWKSSLHKNWHFVKKLPDLSMLFSLILDKREQNNQIIKGENIASQLEESFDTFKKDCKKFKQETVKIKLDKKKTDKLKSLGYVN